MNILHWEFFFLHENFKYQKILTSALRQNFKNQTSYMGKLRTWECHNQEALY
jgi:hypothetical protein